MFRLLNRTFWGGAAAYTIWDTSTDEQLVLRFMRTLGVGVKILYNYKIKFDEDNVNEVHEDTARAIYNLCKNNDGLYVKFGQQVAASEHVLPPVYFKYFSQLQDKAKSSPKEKVISQLKEELKINDLNEVFQDFEEEPVASASIAQVHRATLKNGDKVAVKIQKPNIKRQFASDMFAHYLFCFALQHAFDLPLLTFQQTIEDNLSKEIDFRLESSNAEQCRRDLEKVNRTNVYIPQIYHQFTSERTMIMEWIDGIKITETERLTQENYDIFKLLYSVIETFSEQIFITGFVHCDPHPGNIFARRLPNGQQQVVLLDFGLCIPIREDFRIEYCKFWRSMFLHDTVEMKNVVSKWGIHDEEAFASSSLMKPYSKNKHINEKITKKEVYELQYKFKKDFKKMLGDTNKFPDELVFLGRNMNLVRSINKRLGSVINRVNVMVKFAVKGLNYQNVDYKTDDKFDQTHHKLVKRKRGENYNELQQKIQVVLFSCRLFVSGVLYKFIQFWLRITRNKSFEEMIEDEIKQAAEEKYRQYGMKPMDENTFNA